MLTAWIVTERTACRGSSAPHFVTDRPFASVLADAGRRELVTPITRSETATGAFATARPAASTSVPSTTARSPYWSVRTTARDLPLNHARTRGATLEPLEAALRWRERGRDEMAAVVVTRRRRAQTCSSHDGRRRHVLLDSESYAHLGHPLEDSRRGAVAPCFDVLDADAILAGYETGRRRGRPRRSALVPLPGRRRPGHRDAAWPPDRAWVDAARCLIVERHARRTESRWATDLAGSERDTPAAVERSASRTRSSVPQPGTRERRERDDRRTEPPRMRRDARAARWQRRTARRAGEVARDCACSRRSATSHRGPGASARSRRPQVRVTNASRCGARDRLASRARDRLPSSCRRARRRPRTRAVGQMAHASTADSRISSAIREGICSL